MTSFLINPYRFGAAYDTDAQTYITAVETADGQALETAVRDAMNALVVALKAGSLWTDAAQLLLPCGPRTLSGALVPLKGTAPTNAGFSLGDYNRKTGLIGNGSSKYLNSNILQNSLPGSSHALAWYGNVTDNTANNSLIGSFNSNTNTEGSLLTLDAWAPYIPGRGFRSATYTLGQFPVSTSTATADCLIGSRTALNSATLYVSGTATTNTTAVSPGFEARTLYWFAMNQSGVPVIHASSRLAVGGIYSAGLNATQAAAYRSAAAAYVSALAAAIP